MHDPGAYVDRLSATGVKDSDKAVDTQDDHKGEQKDLHKPIPVGLTSLNHKYIRIISPNTIDSTPPTPMVQGTAIYGWKKAKSV